MLVHSSTTLQQLISNQFNVGPQQQICYSNSSGCLQIMQQQKQIDYSTSNDCLQRDNISHLLENSKLDKATYAYLIRRSGDSKSLAEVKLLHSHLMQLRNGDLAKDRFLANTLIQMYSKCDSFQDAYDVFTNIHYKNAYTWSLMIGACVLHDELVLAIRLYHNMRSEGQIPDRVIYVTVLNACTSKSFLREGQTIHAHILESGFELDIHVGTALLSMYGRCTMLDRAIVMFEKMPDHNVVSWNSIADAHVGHGNCEKALEIFHLMLCNHVSPSNVSFLIALSACRCLEEGRYVNKCIYSFGLDLDVTVSTTLMSMYGKLGSMDDAQKVFEGISFKTIVSWNTMITTYAQNGYLKQALDLIEEMKVLFCLDQATFLSILSGCAVASAAMEGQLVHSSIVCIALDFDTAVANALIDMYAKCGHTEDARSVFNKMFERDLISWNTMIGAYALNGRGEEALDIFQEMQKKGVKPDNITFYNVLSGCSHAGLIHQACFLFISMQMNHNVGATVEHYNCMVDLLGRTGRLEEGEDLIEGMPVFPTFSSWMSLLSSCRIHGDIRRAHRSLGYILKLDHESAGPFAVLSNTVHHLIYE